MNKNHTFGLTQFFTDKPLNVKVIAHDYTTLCKINRDKFIKIVRKFDEDYERYCRMKDKINNEMF